MKLTKYVPILMMFVMFSCMAQSKGELFEEIAYSAYTRGTNISIKVAKGKLVYTGNYGAKEVVLTSAQKAKINDLVKALDVNEISALKAPSEKRITDGALHGEFEIKVGEKKYKSSVFDAGNPPKKLKPLEDYLNQLVGGVD